MLARAGLIRTTVLPSVTADDRPLVEIGRRFLHYPASEFFLFVPSFRRPASPGRTYQSCAIEEIA